METQSNREAVELTEIRSDIGAELVGFPPDVGQNNTTGLLNDRCDVCSQNLQICIAATHQAALASLAYEKASLRAIAERLQEHQIRFDIWKTDCDFTKGSLSVITREQEAGLYQLINNVFTRMNANLSSLHGHIGEVRAPRRAVPNQWFDEIKSYILDDCDQLTQRLQEVADLQPSIQMAYAVHLDEEPYIRWRKDLDNIHERYVASGEGKNENNESENATEEDIDHPSGSERCTKCDELFPYHAMEFHTRTCRGMIGDSPAVVVPKSPSVKKKDKNRRWHSSDSTTEVSGPEAIKSTSSLGRIGIAASQPKRDENLSIISGPSKALVPPPYHASLRKDELLDPVQSLRRFRNYLWGISSSRSAIEMTSMPGSFNATRRYPQEDLISSLHGTVYTFHNIDKSRVQWNLASARHLETELMRTQDLGALANLVFLCGNQTPASIAALGNVCNLDPEYLRRHLRFATTDDFSQSPDELSDALSLPSLPSTSENIVTLRYTTIGHAPHGINESVVWKLNDRSLHSKSIVRKISWHKAGYVSIEQEVSVCVKRYQSRDGTRKYWIGFVWFDSGKEPWWNSTLDIGKDTKILPTLPYKSTAAPAPEVDPYFIPPPDTYRGYQSAQTLHKHYGENLDPNLMKADAFYALHELFQFCAFSEVQFLNLMEKQLSLWRSDRDSTRKNGTAFDYDKLEQTMLLIEDHLTYLEETTDILWRQGSLDWPVATERSDIKKTEAAARQLMTDYTYLGHQARRLLRLYGDKHLAPKMSTPTTPHSSKPPSNNSSGVGQIFMLLPILVATFFSMNFRELQDLSLWVYFTTLLVLALVVPLILWFVLIARHPHQPLRKDTKKSFDVDTDQKRRPSMQV